MRLLIRFAIRFAVIFAIIVVIIQPFNWFCQLTQQCRPFYFSYYLPKQEGAMPIDVIFESTNYREDLDFRPYENAISTVTNKKNTIIYLAKNLSEKTITFRPKLIVEPEYAEGYITRYECLCSHEYKLKKGESIEMTMEFEIDRKIEKDSKFMNKPEKSIKVRFKI